MAQLSKCNWPVFDLTYFILVQNLWFVDQVAVFCAVLFKCHSKLSNPVRPTPARVMIQYNSEIYTKTLYGQSYGGQFSHLND